MKEAVANGMMATVIQIAKVSIATGMEEAIVMFQRRNKHGLMLAVLCGLLAASNGMAMERSSSGPAIEQAIRVALEANLKIAEAKSTALRQKIAAIKACYAQDKIYTSAGCADIPVVVTGCSCSGSSVSGVSRALGADTQGTASATSDNAYILGLDN